MSIRELIGDGTLNGYRLFVGSGSGYLFIGFADELAQSEGAIDAYWVEHWRIRVYQTLSIRIPKMEQDVIRARDSIVTRERELSNDLAHVLSMQQYKYRIADEAKEIGIAEAECAALPDDERKTATAEIESRKQQLNDAADFVNHQQAMAEADIAILYLALKRCKSELAKCESSLRTAKHYLVTLRNNAFNYAPLLDRPIRSVYFKDDIPEKTEQGLAIIIAGDESGPYWFNSEAMKRKYWHGSQCTYSCPSVKEVDKQNDGDNGER